MTAITASQAQSTQVTAIAGDAIAGSDAPSFAGDRKEKEGLAAMTASTLSSASPSAELSPAQTLATARQTALEALKRHSEIVKQYLADPTCKKYLEAETTVRSKISGLSSASASEYTSLPGYSVAGMSEDCRSRAAIALKHLCSELTLTRISYNVSSEIEVQTVAKAFYQAFQSLYASPKASALYEEQANPQNCKKELRPYVAAYLKVHGYGDFVHKVSGSFANEFRDSSFNPYSLLQEVAREVVRTSFQQ